MHMSMMTLRAMGAAVVPLMMAMSGDVGRNLPKSKELLKQLSTGRWAFDCL